MMNNIRDINVVAHIIDYCNQINHTIETFGKDYSIFENNSIYKNAIAMCILQIGELVGALSDGFKLKYNDIPWREIRGMRNVVAHNYGNIEIDSTWETITRDIPELKSFCDEILKS